MPLGTTIETCNGVWKTVACGTSNEDDSECEVSGLFTILSVTVAQLALNATCEYQQVQELSDASGTYGNLSDSIRVTGTCIGIFNVCTGKLTADCNCLR